PNPTEFSLDSEQYEIESVDTDSLETNSVKTSKPVMCSTRKADQFKNLTLNKTPSRDKNALGTKARLKQLRINKSSVGILSISSDSENNSLSQETRENRPQKYQTTKKGALDDAIPLKKSPPGEITVLNAEDID
ncbi:hypothetical protein CBL_21150, partial [Carabus blaptoides fortunei]